MSNERDRLTPEDSTAKHPMEIAINFLPPSPREQFRFAYNYASDRLGKLTVSTYLRNKLGYLRRMPKTSLTDAEKSDYGTIAACAVGSVMLFGAASYLGDNYDNIMTALDGVGNFVGDVILPYAQD